MLQFYFTHPTNRMDLSINQPIYESIYLLLIFLNYKKTTFIEYLIGRDFPGERIGPEPTTDKFVAIMSGGENFEMKDYKNKKNKLSN